MQIFFTIYIYYVYLIRIGKSRKRRYRSSRTLNIPLISYSEYISSLRSFIRLLLRTYTYSLDRIDFKHTHTHTRTYTHILYKKRNKERRLDYPP